MGGLGREQQEVPSSSWLNCEGCVIPWSRQVTPLPCSCQKIPQHLAQGLASVAAPRRDSSLIEPPNLEVPPSSASTASHSSRLAFATQASRTSSSYQIHSRSPCLLLIPSFDLVTFTLPCAYSLNTTTTTTNIHTIHGTVLQRPPTGSGLHRIGFQLHPPPPHPQPPRWLPIIPISNAASDSGCISLDTPAPPPVSTSWLPLSPAHKHHQI